MGELEISGAKIESSIVLLVLYSGLERDNREEILYEGNDKREEISWESYTSNKSHTEK